MAKINVENLNRTQLRAVCKQAGFVGYGKLGAADLRTYIKRRMAKVNRVIGTVTTASKTNTASRTAR